MGFETFGLNIETDYYRDSHAHIPIPKQQAVVFSSSVPPGGAWVRIEHLGFGTERPRSGRIDQSTTDLPPGHIAHHHGEVLQMPQRASAVCLQLAGLPDGLCRPLGDQETGVGQLEGGLFQGINAHRE
jgi:hypothetical protein